MLFMKARHLAVLAVCALASTAGSGVIAYWALAGHGDKALAERVLFTAALLSFAVLVSLAYALRGARVTYRKLDKVLELSRSRGAVQETRLAEFGGLGRAVAEFYRELGETSSRRADLIFLLRALSEGLLGFVEKPVAVADAAGRFVFAGPRFAETYRAQASLRGKELTEIFPELDFAQILNETDSTHGPAEAECSGDRLTFYPVHDRANVVAYLILAAGWKPETYRFAAPAPGGDSAETAEQRSWKNKIAGFLNDTFGRK